MNCFFDTSAERSDNDRYNIYLVLCSPFSQFKRSCLYFARFSSRLVTMLFSCGHAISQIHKIFFCLTSNVRSSLLDVVVFLKLNSKSHMVILQGIPLHHFCLYHFMSFSTKLNSFAREIANIINAVMLGQILAKRCPTVSLCWPHSLHLLHLASPLEAFHDFVSTICSSIVITIIIIIIIILLLLLLLLLISFLLLLSLLLLLLLLLLC